MELTGIRIVLAMCMLPALLILLGICWFLADVKNGVLFGVTLWQGAKEAEVQEIKKRYKKELKSCTLISILLFFLALLPAYESLIITGATFWMFFVIVFLFIPFQRANSRMKDRKREFLASRQENDNSREREEILVDVTAAAAEKIKYSRKAIYGGCIFASLAPAAEVFLYPFRYRPWMLNLQVRECILLSIALTAWLFLLYIRLFERQRTKVFTYSSQVNLQAAKLRQYRLGRLCASMAWMTGALNWAFLCSFHAPAKWLPWSMAAAGTLYGTVSAALVFCCWRKIERSSKKYLAQEVLAEGDDDKYWIGGMVYYNKNDSRSFVEPRIGLGLTANMAKPGIRYAAVFILALLVVFTAGACGLCILEEFTPVSLAYENGTLTANHWKKVYQIEQSEIKEVTLLEEEPEIRRKSGTGMATVKKGDFYSDTYRLDIKVCINPKEPPFLMIESAEGSWYLLGGNDGETVIDILNKIHP